jgi:hypothetical protein
MNDITSKILNILEEENVTPEKMEEELIKVIENIKYRLWEKISVSPAILYSLKDIVWFNLEHLPLGGESKGNSSLKYLGAKFPILAYKVDIGYINKENIIPLLSELEEISNEWSNDWTNVQLFTQSNEGWNGGVNDPSPVIIYDSNTEKPSKYGYKHYPSSSVIINDDIVFSEQQEIVLCAISSKLGLYGQEPLMRLFLQNLINVCKKAIKNNKGIQIEFSNYNYN